MAWNRPYQNNQAKEVQHRRRSTRSVVLGLIGTAVVLSALSVGMILLRSESNAKEESKEARKKQTIKSVNPVSPAIVTSTAPTVLSWPAKNPNRKDGKWLHGEGPRSIAVTNGNIVSYPHYPGVQQILPRPHERAPFENFTDNEIYRLLSLKTGEFTHETTLPPDFDHKFAESLLNPIKINEDDTPETAEMKRQVIEVRKTLVQAVKNGESPRELILAEEKNLRRMAGIRDNYMQMIREAEASGASDQDILDTVNAANQLLEREGIELKVCPSWNAKLRIERAKRDGTIQD